LTQRILTPVRTLEQAAREWAAGNLDERVSVRTSDEFETLAATFNRMAATLSNTLQRLRDADNRLTAERNRLRAILDTSPAGIIVIDNSEVVSLVNQAAKSLLGDGVLLDQPIRAGSVVERTYHPDGTPYRAEDLPIIRCLKDGVSIAGAELLVRRPNGWEVHLLVNCAPIRADDGTIVGSASVFFDISPFAEEERLRTEFVVSAAHEFRNPLTVIKGYAEVAMRDPNVRGTGVYRELTRILDAANRVSRLADELLRSAELHLPPLVLRTEVLDLDVLVTDTVERFRQTEAGHDYQVVVSVRPARVEGDPALLAEAVTNLLRQAEAAMPSGGEIDVEVSAWDGIATIAVTDQGPIVPSERVPSLFLPFAISAQSPASTMTPRPTLLLYLTKRIVQESGGWIRAESSPAGTRILITLPRYPSHRLPRPRATPDEALGIPTATAAAPGSPPRAETGVTRGNGS
jgi:PAS domain S-box-containing protein